MIGKVGRPFNSVRAPLLRRVGFTAVLLGLAAGSALAADTAPKRGGTLEFSVENELGNYDCHANTSFAAMHPLAPHYSTRTRQ